MNVYARITMGVSKMILCASRVGQFLQTKKNCAKPARKRREVSNKNRRDDCGLLPHASDFIFHFLLNWLETWRECVFMVPGDVILELVTIFRMSEPKSLININEEVCNS